jgi:hypothetical protein
MPTEPVKPPEHFALPWYEKEEEYKAVASMLPPDEGNDPILYDAFVSKIQNTENQAQRLGAITHRIPINPIELKAWCDENHLRVCRDSISKFGMVKLAEKLAASGNN